jgi:hypothetical protein
LVVAAFGHQLELIVFNVDFRNQVVIALEMHFVVCVEVVV